MALQEVAHSILSSLLGAPPCSTCYVARGYGRISSHDIGSKQREVMLAHFARSVHNRQASSMSNLRIYITSAVY